MHYSANIFTGDDRVMLFYREPVRNCCYIWSIEQKITESIPSESVVLIYS
jgi:hypothetical protein